VRTVLIPDSGSGSDRGEATRWDSAPQRDGEGDDGEPCHEARTAMDPDVQPEPFSKV
jgi:hypothetical protein